MYVIKKHKRVTLAIKAVQQQNTLVAIITYLLARHSIAVPLTKFRQMGNYSPLGIVDGSICGISGVGTG
jgi:hypothetical protein